MGFGLAQTSHVRQAFAASARTAPKSIAEARFDFGTPDSPVSPGWTEVTPITGYFSDQGYGWEGSTGLSASDQGVHNPLDRDFVRGTVPRTFRVDLPNGIWEVWALVQNSAEDVPLMTMTINTQYPLPLPWFPLSGSGFPNAPRQLVYSSDLTAIEGYPTTDYHWNINVTNSRMDIVFSSSSGVWQINALALLPQSSPYSSDRAYEVAVSNQHTAPATRSLPVFTVPSRFPLRSNLFGDYTADWNYVKSWIDSITTRTMTPAEKFRAVAAPIRSFSGPWSPSNHPVDVLYAGNGSCTGVANLLTMSAWVLGLPARNLIIYADSGLDMPLAMPSDPYNSSEGSAHEISEVYLDGEWRTFDTGYEHASFMDFLVGATQWGTIPQYHIYAARSVIYHGWDGVSSWHSVYSPSTASLLYPGQSDYQYRLKTHDPRWPRLLRIDDAGWFDGTPLKIEPGTNVLNKTFWLSALREDEQTIIARIPFTQDYEGTPHVNDWYMKVNGNEHLLGKANTAWGANAGQMLEVEIPPGELNRGWNTLELGAKTVNSDEGLWVNTTNQASNSQTTLMTGTLSQSVPDAVWFLDVQYAQFVDPAPPSAASDLHITGLSPNGATLAWTVPGDDLYLGSASRYEVRSAEFPITTSTWVSATKQVVGPYMQAAGAVQTVNVDEELAPGHLYYFALKSYDDIGNVSPLSDDLLLRPQYLYLPSIMVGPQYLYLPSIMNRALCPSGCP